MNLWERLRPQDIATRIFMLPLLVVTTTSRAICFSILAASIWEILEVSLNYIRLGDDRLVKVAILILFVYAIS